MRPRGTAGRMARHCVATGAFPRSRWPRRGNVVLAAMPSFAGVRSPPLRGGASQGERALRGKPGDNAGGGFLGGARSPRPDCKAELAPWHSISTRWGARGGWPTGGMSRRNPCLPLRACGARPSKGGGSQVRWPSGEGPGDRRRAVFSEGRGLRARIARPN